MRKFACITIMLGLLSLPVWAQTTGQNYSRGEVFGGYSLLNGDTFSNASGINVSVMGNVRPWFGLKADLSAHYKTVFGASAREYNVVFGPQFSHQFSRFTTFAHAMGGFARVSADGGGSDTGEAWILGGGADYSINSRFGIRLVQADYHGDKLFNNTQRDFRYSGGVVFKF